MLYLMVTQLGWLAFTILLIVVVALYTRIARKIEHLRRDVTNLQAELEQQRHRSMTPSSAPLIDKNDYARKAATNDPHLKGNVPKDSDAKDHDAKEIAFDSQHSSPDNQLPVSPPPLPTVASNSTIHAASSIYDDKSIGNNASINTKNTASTAPIEPDERSLPIVTSLIHSIKNWFFGGNLVVRVGVLVLLVGVVLLLRLLSEYIEISIATKLIAVGVTGLALAALGLKLTAKRFSYGITLQGAGLAIAYLSTFFAYSVYEIIPSIPSFIGLGLLSAITIALAVRQNAFPLALLALSGGFFAPILTSEDTGSLVTLFSYYLLLNVTIAVIAHYRPWKILNLFGVTVTFGLAYYWGISENLSTVIETQRWSLIALVTLHWLLYLFVVIRYAQQIITYNALNEKNLSHADNVDGTKHLDKGLVGSSYVFPIDTGLLFSVPLLAFGLFSALLNDISNALTITSAILATVYLGLGWLFIQRSKRYALITEGMLALGLGFFALVIPMALDAEWIAFGWSVQGLALVWFGRRSLRSWSVLFGLLLQLVSIGMLVTTAIFSIEDYPVLAFSISALSYLATVFILRASNSPAALINTLDGSNNLNNKGATTSSVIQSLDSTSDALTNYAHALGVSTQAAQQWLTSIDSQSRVFKFVWHSPRFIKFLTLTAMAWLLQVLMLDLHHWFDIWQSSTTVIALAALMSLIAYWVINRYRPWAEIRQLSHGLLALFYFMLILQLPQKFEQNLTWSTTEWLVFVGLIIGWLVMGQLWLKTWSDTWSDNKNTSRYTAASWLGTGILLIAAAAHYGLPDSDGVMAFLFSAALILFGLWFNHRYLSQNEENTSTNKISEQGLLYWFDWQQALLGCAAIFAPIALLWVVLTNWSYDGVIWGMSYFPLFNLYDITSWLTLSVGFSLYYISQRRRNDTVIDSSAAAKSKRVLTTENLLIILGLISFWLISSMLVRTLHAFIGTPLWNDYQGGAWQSEQVQTGLTILWTLLALVATILASRYWQRALWFMGIELLGIVVLKLVLVDLSQTEAIWRVISFLGAGSLILLIGYLAPLPPAQEETENQNQA
ncbi:MULTISPECIES: DUF2339 domain-containing protein [Psychrobacter]|uniref:DUF2339 domain-containing protein n=1 Tax=Psychrobacter TaxID=497 RepID=UPI000C325A90|nr:MULTISPECIES: DUF2339 domain-containing protein [Psychrobacter]MBA6243586.1 DUF2339 domain-containing protein [Psychrobacter sp. Urea-trap-18]MBA6284851.1 DUF2339 domain-containing protein [Psychrobacter sp. Urea-trap-16]MBA6317311.1 DUF2339 domain-containing protein [Psychrobacter sp. Urea-trap-20]MBA6334950.1 DUF2339 domain-containing protein [Psychrobacter sp. Urea-trap-19]PKG61056.1 DUF2339 domain-containing protein [Psychrobacter sp. Choline-3u-12]